MSVLAMIMKLFSYLFHFFLALGMLGLSMVAITSGNHNLRLDLFPWSGAALSYWLLGLGVAGIALVALALRGTLRILFLVWAVAALVMLTRGFFFSPMVFDGWAGFQWAMLVLLAALVAAVGAWFVFRTSPARR